MSGKAKAWVHRLKLLNRSKHQKIGELKAFLRNKGLIGQLGQPTEKAIALGFVRTQDGKEMESSKVHRTNAGRQEGQETPKAE